MVKISIIVPVYNSEKYLKRCIDSLIYQKKFNDYEIILINDGSTDNSGRICDEYVKKNKNIKVFHKKNEGVSKARNLGIIEARGEYITFVDSDDYIEENMLYEFSKSIEDNNSDIIFCGQNNISIINSQKKEYLAYKFDNITVDIFIDKYFMYYYKNFLIQGPYNKIYKNEIIKCNNLKFDENLKICEDAIFVISCLNNSKSVSSIEGCYYNYMQNGVEDTLLRRFNENEIQANWELYDKFVQILRNKNKSDINIYFLKVDFVNRFITCLKKMFLKSGYNRKKLFCELNEFIEDKRLLNLKDVKYKTNVFNKIIFFCIKRKLKFFSYICLKIYVVIKHHIHVRR